MFESLTPPQRMVRACHGYGQRNHRGERECVCLDRLNRNRTQGAIQLVRELIVDIW